MGTEVKITVGDKEVVYPQGTTYGEIAGDFQKDYPWDIILAQKGGKLVEWP